MNTTVEIVTQPTPHPYAAFKEQVARPACQLTLCDFIATNDGWREIQQLTQWDDGAITISWKGGTKRCQPSDYIGIKKVI